jgi:hypothetical protein
MANDLKNPFEQFRPKPRVRLMHKTIVAATLLGLLSLSSSAGAAGNRLPLRYSRFPAADNTKPQPEAFCSNQLARF